MKRPASGQGAAQIDGALGRLAGSSAVAGGGANIGTLVTLADFAVGLMPDSIRDGVRELTTSASGRLLLSADPFGALLGLGHGAVTGSLEAAAQDQEAHDRAAEQAGTSACGCADAMSEVATSCAASVEQCVAGATTVADTLVALADGLAGLLTPAAAVALRDAAQQVLATAGDATGELLQQRNCALETCTETLIADCAPAAEPGRCHDPLTTPTCAVDTGTAGVPPSIPEPSVPGDVSTQPAAVAPCPPGPPGAPVPVPAAPDAVIGTAVQTAATAVGSLVQSAAAVVGGAVDALTGAVAGGVNGVSGVHAVAAPAVDIAVPDLAATPCPPPVSEADCGCPPEPEPEPEPSCPSEVAPEPELPEPEQEPEPDVEATVDPVHGFDKSTYLFEQETGVSDQGGEDDAEAPVGAGVEPDLPEPETEPEPEPEPAPPPPSAPAAVDVPAPPQAESTDTWDPELWLSGDDGGVVVERSGDW
ncbi:hypothetical protein [Corynebacterium nuruki]|uniref:hypothetical protein n=1 Tax=Corynebacterium nuruki TaxID=1032851 RepID=UPI00024855F2|nr:hypothetical protein [Corynebacterium nuruki]